MHIKKIGINILVLIGIILFNTNTIQAEENRNLFHKVKLTQDENNSEKNRINKYKKIELNKIYSHEIRYEPYDKKYDPDLYIEFTIPKDGYIYFERSDLKDIDLNIYEKNFRYALGFGDQDIDTNNQSDRHIRQALAYNGGKYIKDHKIGLKKGTYRIRIDPAFQIDRDYIMDYQVKFEEKDIVDIEPNGEIKSSCEIKFNKLYEGMYDFKYDYDYYKFNNHIKNDIKLKFKSHQVDDDNEKNDMRISLFKDNGYNNYQSIKSLKFKDLEFDGEYYTFEFERLPKGEYAILFDKYYSNIQEYEFIIEAPKVFIDIEGHWANKTITDFIKKGYINGYEDNTFRPDNNITRAEFVKVLNTALGLTEKKGITFSDTTNHWAREAIDIAVTNGICKGVSDTEFKPDDYITREQVSVMIANYKKIKDTDHDKLNQYTDSNIVSSWAIDSVEGMIENKYMNGYSEDNTFRPINNITRAEAVSTLSRVIK